MKGLIPIRKEVLLAMVEAGIDQVNQEMARDFEERGLDAMVDEAREGITREGAAFREMLAETGAPDEVIEVFEEKQNATVEELEIDPGRIFHMKAAMALLEEIKRGFMEGTFADLPGTKTEVEIVHKDNGDVECVRVERRPMTDQEIEEISTNGLQDLENFLHSRVDG
jgi:hypothetical protein